MKKQEIITFKADENLSEALKDIPNRSEFIRSSILAALDNSCPLCKGAGTISVAQKKHWVDFKNNHSIVKCEKCNDTYIKCNHEKEAVLDH